MIDPGDINGPWNGSSSTRGTATPSAPWATTTRLARWRSHRRNRHEPHRHDPGSPWLFPGRRAGQPLHPITVAKPSAGTGATFSRYAPGDHTRSPRPLPKRRAKMERELIHERTMDGLAAVNAQGP